jgi:hypothetical protein
VKRVRAIMTVQFSDTVPPINAGRRKYIQKMTIRSGMPRIMLITAREEYLIILLWEIQRSPSTMPPKKERTHETTAR